MQTIITLTIEHKKPILDLLDKVAGRVYTLDGVDDTTADFAGHVNFLEENVHDDADMYKKSDILNMRAA
jgi:hypothetical protein